MNALHNKILNIIEELYGPCNHNKYFLVNNRKESDIRQEILNKFSECSIEQSKLDIFVVTTQMNEDVFIRV